MCVGQRGGGHGRITEYAAIIIKAHGTQCSEEKAGKYDRNEILVCIAVQAAVQLRATNAASESTMGSRCSWSAYAPLLRHSRLRCETAVSQQMLTTVSGGFTSIRWRIKPQYVLLVVINWNDPAY